MGNAMFYHLTRTPADALVPMLIGKARAAGWRVELRGTDAETLERLDKKLWEAEAFLPHGQQGGPHDARQPVLLTLAGQPAANNPACLLTLNGAEVNPQECQSLERTCIIFDGASPPATDRARDQWRSLTAAGITAEYWSEESGRWTRKR
ncbi:MAG: DNA polymerase III subunit chi [Paracoccus sp. (in: a-proteobacteria)]|uniref:DNA polymerase III subunit chi n=1 Tax=Paracoccus sp. TaxID=267 RepID=UPI0026E05391|nr:DNA polymerase III subunit chi [Paracoccus sp. (in: a-proteobacteria)]MDO5613923.1 DNA polymerase III subunit chi [Paracoccus sp. (in: a-proteobacteria)]